MTPATPPALVCHACPASTLEHMLQDSPSGTVVRVVGGIYRGNFTVGRGVTVRGERATLDGGGAGTVLTVAGAGARISGLTVRNSGRDFVGIDAGVRISAPDVRLENATLVDNLFGIDVKGAPRVIIRGVTVEGLADRPIPLRGDALRLWYSPDARIQDNTFRGSRDMLLWFSNGAKLVGNRVSDCRYGMHAMYESRLTIAGNTVSSCEVGSYLMYSKHLDIERNVFLHNRGSTGYGVALKSADDVSVRNNAFVDDHVGVYLDDSPSARDATLNVEDNLFAYDGVGFSATPATRGGAVVGNAFIDNLVQARATGRGDLRGMTWSSGDRGNYWSDYAGYDPTGRGVGDIPYAAVTAFGTLAAQEPALQLFAYSPAATAVDFAARALPAFAPSVQLIDRAPALRPRLPQNLPWPRRSGSLVPLAAFAALMLVGAGVGVLFRGAGSSVRARKGEDRKEDRMLQAVPLIAGAAVRKAYGSSLALREATFQVRAGQTVALWGPNGAGKTTLLRCILGQVRYQGSLTVAGLTPSPRDPRSRALMGYAPQALPDFEMTAGELAAFVSSLRGSGAAAVERVLAETGTDQVRKMSVGALSGGMRQRLNLALSLLADPPILVLDEPTAGLDRASHRGLLNILRAQKAKGKTIVFTSHDIADVVALADVVVMMEEGRIVATLDAARFAETVYAEREEEVSWRPA